jgi:hypothetical protein
MLISRLDALEHDPGRVVRTTAELHAEQCLVITGGTTGL